MNCRHCSTKVVHSLIDLGSSPPSNSYLTQQKLTSPEKWYPLRVLVCSKCFLVQTEDFTEADELFNSEYAYFSSYSKSWLEHAEIYASNMTQKFNLNSNSMVIEIASNDGYLLQFFKKNNIPCIGIEPTRSTADAAKSKGLKVIEKFFGTKLANQMVSDGIKADLTTANNVLAHVPDINDFVKGFSILLKDDGVSTFEFPHLVNLIEENQFDTIYHEHFSYLSLTSVQTIFENNGLSIFDVEKLSTHGGSLRVYAQKNITKSKPISKNLNELLIEEKLKGISSLDYYSNFQVKANKVKNNFYKFLIEKSIEGKTVTAYGAAAKGNTLINYAGIKKDLLQFVVDKNPSKQNKFLPGSRIPILEEDILKKTKPDYVIILPWNLKSEIMNQLSYIRNWNGKFVVAIPSLEEF
jgi:hypothetical protein